MEKQNPNKNLFYYILYYYYICIIYHVLLYTITNAPFLLDISHVSCARLQLPVSPKIT